MSPRDLCRSTQDRFIDGGHMFGSYDVPFNLEMEGISLSIEKDGENLRYRRESPGEKAEKILLANSPKLLINPIEPMSKPKDLTPYLFIEFAKSLAVEPKATKKIFIKFPVEIGVFVSLGRDFEALDIFCMTPQKFTLYGDPRTGIICKYFKSDVYGSIPSVDPIREGVIEVTVTNTTTSWVDVTKTVFSAYGMKIYYNDRMVSLKANMKIKGSQMAEIDFEDSPVETDMNKSLEIYAMRKLTIATTKFVMELGL